MVQNYKIVQSYTTPSLLEVLFVFVAMYFGSYIQLPLTFYLLFVIRDVVTFKAPTTVHKNYSEDQPEDGSVYEPKHVANTSNKLRVVYGYIIL